MVGLSHKNLKDPGILRDVLSAVSWVLWARCKWKSRESEKHQIVCFSVSDM